MTNPEDAAWLFLIRLSSLFLLLDQLSELIEKICRVVRAGRCFRMILHTEDRQFFVTHSLNRAVVQIDMSYFHSRRQRLCVDGESVVLRSDCHFAGAQIFYRLVSAAMAEFQFEGRSAKRETENLMTKTDSEDRLLAHQIANSFVRVRQRRGIAGAVGEKNSVWITCQRFLASR